MRLIARLVGVVGVGFGTCVFGAEPEKAWEPAYRLQQMGRVTIDAQTRDWPDGAFRIEALSPLDGRIVPSADFDSLVRLGWNTDGLLVTVAVVDNVIVEGADDERLAEGDGVEILIAGGGTAVDRYVIAPGADGKHDTARAWVSQKRTFETVKQDAPPFRAAGRKTRAGYVIEALIPFRNATDLKGPRVQVIVNDSDRPGQRRRYAWYPMDDTADHWAHSYDTTLAEDAGPPVTAAIAGRYEGTRQSRVTVVATRAEEGKLIEVGEGSSLKGGPLSGDVRLPLALGKVGRIEDKFGAYLTFGLPPLGTSYGPLNVYVDGRQVGQVTPVDIDARRRIALSGIDVVFKPAVFGGDAFPRGDFADPARAREVLGSAYTMTATFYDSSYEKVERAEKPGRYGAVVEVTTDGGVKLPRRLVTLYRQKDAGPWREEQLNVRLALPPQIGLDAAVVEQQRAAVVGMAAERVADGLSSDPDAAVLIAALAEAKAGEPPMGGSTSMWARDQQWWFGLKKKLGVERYHYLVDLPRGYTQNVRGKRYPVLLFLHGSGERGDDLAQVRAHGPAKMRGDLADAADANGVSPFPAHFDEFMVVSPQCPAGEWWSAPQLALLLDEVEKVYRADPDRVYVTGLSMGGYGTWELAAAYPKRFAAIAPVCGAGGVGDANVLRDLPAWVFHGEKDDAVPFARSVEMVEALKAAGGRVRFTRYPDAGHDAWTRTYADPELYAWLLRQQRGAPAEPRAK